MLDSGRGAILGPLLCIAGLCWLGVTFPRLWFLGIAAGLMLLTLYEVQ